jgi:hypothetical protein
MDYQEGAAGSKEHDPSLRLFELLKDLRTTELHYIEVADVAELRKDFVQAVKSGSDAETKRTLYHGYCDAAREDIAWMREREPHVGCLIACADVLIEVGMVEDCVIDLEDAYMSAYNTPGLELAAKRLGAIIGGLEILIIDHELSRQK